MNLKDSKLKLKRFHTPRYWLFWLVDEENNLIWEFPGWDNLKAYSEPQHTCHQKEYLSTHLELPPYKDFCECKPPEIYYNMWKTFLNFKIRPEFGGDCGCVVCEDVGKVNK